MVIATPRKKFKKRYSEAVTHNSRRKLLQEAHKRNGTGRVVMTMANAVRTMNSIIGDTEATSEQLRDMNKECGYPETLTLLDLTSIYDREGVAQRVVHVYPVETWKTPPTIYELLENVVTDFEKAVSELESRFNLWSVLERADKLSGIGNFGIILLGIDDKKALDKPVKGVESDIEGHKIKKEKCGKSNLLYMRVFDQRYVRILEVDNNTSSPRYGRPTFYGLKMTTATDEGIMAVSSQKEVKVHWTRIIHLADNRSNSELAGSPRLEAAYNRIKDLLKVLGGSSEMFWKGGFPGLSFEVQPGLEDIEFDAEEFREAIDQYANGLQRYLRVVGLKVNSLAPQVADPTPQIDAALDQICITINCPKRIFLGTESAHLASTQDQKTWTDRVGGRRTQYAIPYIIKPVTCRLIMMGALPYVEKFEVDWKDPEEVDPLVRAQALEKVVNAMAQYVSSGLATLLPPLTFLTEIMQLPLETAELIIEAAKKEKASPTLELVQAKDENEMARYGIDAKGKQMEMAAKSKAAATKGTAPAQKSGRKTGTGAKKSVKDVSTGQKGG